MDQANGGREGARGAAHETNNVCTGEREELRPPSKREPRVDSGQRRIGYHIHEDATKSRMGRSGRRRERKRKRRHAFGLGPRPAHVQRRAAIQRARGRHLRRCGRLGYSGDGYGYGIEWGDAGSRYITTMTMTMTGTGGRDGDSTRTGNRKPKERGQRTEEQTRGRG